MISAFLTFIEKKHIPDCNLDLLHILEILFHKINLIELGNFIFLTQLGIKKLKTYN